MREIKFKDFIKLQRGFDLPRKDMVDGIYPVVGSTSIIGWHNEYKIEPPGVVTGRSGSLGAVQYITQKYWAHNTSLWVKDFKGNVPRYVYYFLKEFSLARFNSGAGVPTLNRNDLDNYDIRIHKYSDQLKVSLLLSSYDELIENNNRRIKILEEIAQTIYDEWFVKFRFPGYKRITIKASELGKIPREWEVRSLESVCEKIASGGTPSRSNKSYWEPPQHKWLKTKELRDTYVVDAEEYISTFGLENSAAKLFPAGTIMMAIYAAPTVGRLGVLIEEAAFNQAVCGLIPDLKYLNKYYLFYKLLQLRNHFHSIAQGVAQQNISVEKVRNAKIIISDDKLMLRFAEIIEPIFDLIKNLLFKNSNLKKTRDILLPRLISGEIDVEDLNIKTEDIE